VPVIFALVRWKQWAAWAVVGPAAAWALIRLAGWDSWTPMIQLIAFTPYMAALSLLPLALTVLWRQWPATIAAALATLALAVMVVPRAVGAPEDGQGRPLTILSVNLLKGQADLDAFLRLAEQADVIAVQELTASFAARLDGRFPYAAAYPAPGVEGSGIYSRLPLANAGVRANPFGFLQAHADLAGLHVAVESVHPVAPAQLDWAGEWRESYRRQRPATPDGPMWILAGDFNATLDHAVVRALIDTGYRDAASVVGAGFAGTWGPYDGDLIPAVTLDRVLADRRLGVRSFTVHSLSGTDHRPVQATLILPG
jgi:endonuclease/exonuclease/phosphatase family metal-dependent hydrolase